MKYCLGIISYLPDELSIRQERLKKLKELISKCNEIFDIPIIVIAQNWKNDVPAYKNLTAYYYPKLGIAKARIQLREKFLQSDYDYLIMLDDDCKLFGTREAGQDYLNSLDGREYAFRSPLSLKLFAISQKAYSQIEMPDISPEDNEGYEDIAFYKILTAKFPVENEIIECCIDEVSISFLDKYSTWARGYIDYPLNERKTNEYVQKILNQKWR